MKETKEETHELMIEGIKGIYMKIMRNLSESISKNIIYNDAGSLWQINLQEEGSPIMIGIRDLHDEIMYYIIIIIILVTYILGQNIITYKNKNEKGIEKLNINSKDLNHSTIVELIWTIIPAIILILIAIPSFKLMYSIDEVIKPLITLKVQGNQWYWTYNIVDTIGLNIEFTSYPKGTEDLKIGELRLLEVDNRVILPILIPIRVLITASDVMHAWAIPSLGIKIDAIPGRINHGLIYILREGLYYGQCSELCGQGHAYMPIAIEGVKISNYINWLISFSESNLELPINKILKFIKIIE